MFKNIIISLLALYIVFCQYIFSHYETEIDKLMVSLDNMVIACSTNGDDLENKY